MNKNTTLSIYNNSKVELGKNYLTVKTDLTDEEYREYYAELIKYNDTTNFWIGDLLVDLEAKRGSKIVLDLSEVFECDPKTIENARGLSRHFPKDKRVDGVSWSHHREALGECKKNIDLAVFWLDLSKKNQWTSKGLRVAIREGLSNNNPNNTPPLAVQKSDVLYSEALNGIAAVKRFLNNITSKTPKSQIDDVIDAWTEASDIVEGLL